LVELDDFATKLIAVRIQVLVDLRSVFVDIEPLVFWYFVQLRWVCDVAHGNHPTPEPGPTVCRGRFSEGRVESPGASNSAGTTPEL
jgi:hypothetical protein